MTPASCVALPMVRFQNDFRYRNSLVLVPEVVLEAD